MPAPYFGRLLSAAMMVLLLSVGGCDGQQQGDPRVTVIGEAPSLAGPAAAALSPPQAVLLANVAQGLVRYDARGRVEPGLAERWTVSDDGLSYIFRLQSGEWPDGRKITAHQVARLLRRQFAARRTGPLADTLGAVNEVVAMTDRVIEIRLHAPRPNLLTVLAQPEFAIVLEGQGTGPFRIAADENKEGGLELERTLTLPDGEESRREEVELRAAAAPEAVNSFVKRETDLVLGGTYADLPYARTPDMPRGVLRFDPASGLFGLVPARSGGPLDDLELRRLLSRALDRQALIDAFGVPGLLPRATVLEPGLDGLGDPAPPDWLGVPMAERRPQLMAEAAAMFGDIERPTLRIALPDAPGAHLLLNRIAADWGQLGIMVERAGPGQPADLALIDAVAPSSSPAWFLRHFRCGEVPVCDEQVGELLEGARTATVPAQRYMMLAQAAGVIDEQQLFLAIAAPIRWSLVSDSVPGFAVNRVAHHTLTGLEERLMRERNE